MSLIRSTARQFYFVDRSTETHRRTFNSVAYGNASDPSDDVAVANYVGHEMAVGGGTAQVRSHGNNQGGVFLDGDTLTAAVL
jgi:hypothetical protein